MSLYTNRDSVYNQSPFVAIGNRDEYFIIDIIGNWIPENDIIYYGLLNSQYSEIFYKLCQKYIKFNKRF